MWDYASLAATGSNALGAVGAYWGQQSANRSNEAISARQMQFQREANQGAMNFSRNMSNTEWQRGVADMRAAGVNPMLAVSKGGASAPQGVTSGGAGIPAQNTLSHLPSSISSAVQAMLLKSQLDNMDADTKVKQANAAQSIATLPVTTAQSAVESSILNDLFSGYRTARNAISGHPEKGGLLDRSTKAIGNVAYDTIHYLTTTLPQQIGTSARTVNTRAKDETFARKQANRPYTVIPATLVNSSGS